jgi:hypothetical protein
MKSDSEESEGDIGDLADDPATSRDPDLLSPLDESHFHA